MDEGVLVRLGGGHQSSQSCFSHRPHVELVGFFRLRPLDYALTYVTVHSIIPTHCFSLPLHRLLHCFETAAVERSKCRNAVSCVWVAILLLLCGGVASSFDHRLCHCCPCDVNEETSQAATLCGTGNANTHILFHKNEIDNLSPKGEEACS